MQLNRHIEVVPLLLQLDSLLVGTHHRNRHNPVGAQRVGIGDRVQDTLVDTAHQHHHGVRLALRLVTRAYFDCFGATFVVLAHCCKARHHQRNEDGRNPRAFAELRHHNDECDETRGDRSDGVDRDTELPVRFSMFQVVPHHSRLAQRKAGKDTERVEGNQLRDVSLEHDNQNACDAGKKDHTVGEDEPSTHVGELARQKPVACDKRGKPRKVGIRRVGREDQDHERRDHREPKHHPLAAVDVLGYQPKTVSIFFTAERLQVRRDNRHAKKGAAKNRSHDHERGRSVFALRLLERRNAV